MDSQPIQRGTAGFLSLLELKNLGENPAVLRDSVQPEVNMEPWWLRSIALPYYESRAAAGATLSYQFLSTTERQWLYIHHLSLRLAKATATTGNEEIRVALTHLSSGVVIYADAVHIVANQGQLCLQIRNFWVPPGYIWSVEGAGLTATDALQVCGLFTPPILI